MGRKKVILKKSGKTKENTLIKGTAFFKLKDCAFDIYSIMYIPSTQY